MDNDIANIAVKLKVVVESIRQHDELCGVLKVIDHPISFLGDVDAESGRIRDGGNVKDSILLYPTAVGSTVGSYVIYGLSRSGNAPVAIVTCNEDVVTTVGAVIAGIPLYKLVDCSVIKDLKKYDGRVFCIHDSVLVMKKQVFPLECQERG